MADNCSYRVEYRGGGEEVVKAARRIWDEARGRSEARPEQASPERLDRGAALGIGEVILTITLGPVVQVVVERLADWLKDWMRQRWLGQKGVRVSVVVEAGNYKCLLETDGTETLEQLIEKAQKMQDKLVAAGSVTGR